MVGSQEEGLLQGSSVHGLLISPYLSTFNQPYLRLAGLLVQYHIFCFPSLVCCLECRKWLPKEVINYISAFIKSCL